MPNVSISHYAQVMLHFRKKANLSINVRRHYKSAKVQALFVNVIYEDQVLYAKPKNEVLFVKIKLLYAELSPFQIQFYGAIVSNTQYSTAGGLIYSDNTNFYCVP